MPYRLNRTAMSRDADCHRTLPPLTGGTASVIVEHWSWAVELSLDPPFRTVLGMGIGVCGADRCWWGWQVCSVGFGAAVWPCEVGVCVREQATTGWVLRASF
jgi:hypothetical protein